MSKHKQVIKVAIYVDKDSTLTPIFCETEGGGRERTKCKLHQEA